MLIFLSYVVLVFGFVVTVQTFASFLTFSVISPTLVYALSTNFSKQSHPALGFSLFFLKIFFYAWLQSMYSFKFYLDLLGITNYFSLSSFLTYLEIYIDLCFLPEILFFFNVYEITFLQFLCFLVFFSKFCWSYLIG